MSAVSLLHPIQEKNPCPFFVTGNPWGEKKAYHGQTFPSLPEKTQKEILKFKEEREQSRIMQVGSKVRIIKSGDRWEGKIGTIVGESEGAWKVEIDESPGKSRAFFERSLELISSNPGVEMARGMKKYREFHQGLPPDRIDRVKAPNPKALVELGTADRIYYTREEPKGPREYYHDFGEDSGKRPTLATDPEGKKLFIFGGSFKVKDWIYD